MKITPLHSWIGREIGCDTLLYTRDCIDDYHLIKLNEIVGYARQHSPFYADLYSLNPAEFFSINDFKQLPLMTAEDLKQHTARLLCLPQDNIHRIVTLPTSGTTGESKRIYFSKADQELTIDFFAVGMSTLVQPADRILILLPGERPGGVGDLLFTALTNLGCYPIKHGPFFDAPKVLELIVTKQVNVIVGSPVQLNRLVQFDKFLRITKKGCIRSILTSTDYLPDAIRETLEDYWECEVFDHYGMTETGLGGGVECGVHAGVHLREADLFYEIIDPTTMAPLSDGDEGEVVVTTLTRDAMPLIRYRTGDVSHLITDVCECGSFVRRLAQVRRRLDSGVLIGDGTIHQFDFDDVIFKITGLLDFDVEFMVSSGRHKLMIRIEYIGDDDKCDQQVKQAVVDMILNKYGNLGSLVVEVTNKPKLNENPVLRKRMILMSVQVK